MKKLLWKEFPMRVILVFIFLFVIGEIGIVIYCFGDGYGMYPDGRPINPGYANYIASIMTGPSPTGQYPYGDHRWTQVEGNNFIAQAYFMASGIALIISIIYFLILLVVFYTAQNFGKKLTRQL
jgi:hypothetical protein